MQTIQEAKTFLNAHVKQGVACPACTQFVKLYRRPIHTAMALGLIHFYKNFQPGEFIHCTAIVKVIGSTALGDFAKLKHWQLITEKPKDENDDKKTSGYWSITAKGVDFVKGKIALPKYAVIFDSAFHGFEGEQVFIQDCLNNKFSYSKLMGAQCLGI